MPGEFAAGGQEFAMARSYGLEIASKIRRLGEAYEDGTPRTDLTGGES